MDKLVPVIPAKEKSFPAIPSSARHAILVPSVRFDDNSRSIIGSLIGVANEETIVLIADNSENIEKKRFLEQIRVINPNIFAVHHEKNIGGQGNFDYLFDWSEGVEFTALMADDDWISPDYHVSAFRYLEKMPHLTGAAVGNSIIMHGSPRERTVDGSQPQMVGETPIERMRKWSGVTSRITMYNASRRSALKNAAAYIRRTPIPAITLLEDLWETNRLALGAFVTKPGKGFLVHNPTPTSSWQDIYQRLHGDSALPFSYIYFSALSTAIQLGIFHTGTLSPLNTKNDKTECANHLFDHVFKKQFLATVGGQEKVARSQFSKHPRVLEGFLKYCMPPFPDQITFDQNILEWYISLVDALETKPQNGEIPLSEKFRQFSSDLLPEFQLETP